MSAKRVGVDCCGDRYQVYTTLKCPCGCDLCYCQSCFETHCVEIVKAGGPTRELPKREPT